MASNDVDYAGKGQKKGCGAKVRSFCNGVWNPQKKELLGRTGGSWAKIGVFYLIFYSCLAGFFAIMLMGFFSTVDERTPSMTNMYSLIKQNPGMGFRPMANHESTLVSFNSSDPDTYHDKISNIISYLVDNGYMYENHTIVPSMLDEDKNSTFSLNELAGDCMIDPVNVNNSYGYKDGEPCVLLKINKVFNWMPEPFDEESLKSDHGQEANKTLHGVIKSDYIQISCEGENDGDHDNLGEVKFDPPFGFSYKYFPYTNPKNYRAPVVFAKFSKVRVGVIMQIWCKMWAENIMHHKNDKAGSVRIELMVDTPKP